MCTSIIRNGNKTIVGFNLDILGMKHRINADADHVFIEIWDEQNGWLPLFGVNSRGDFVGMPTCHPYDGRSDQSRASQVSVLMADIDLLLKKRTFEEVKHLAENGEIYSIPQVTWQMQISDRQGNVLRHTPGQGCAYLEKPAYCVMTNFSPWRERRDEHPWSGADRYAIAEKMLRESNSDFDVPDAFAVLKAASQEVCPTVVSIIYDATEHIAYWCENRRWNEIKSQKLKGDKKW